MIELDIPKLLNESSLQKRNRSNSAVAFRRELIHISGRWKELGLAGVCPYPFPASNVLLVHQKDYRNFILAQQLKQQLPELPDNHRYLVSKKRSVDPRVACLVYHYCYATEQR